MHKFALVHFSTKESSTYSNVSAYPRRHFHFHKLANLKAVIMHHYASRRKTLAASVQQRGRKKDIKKKNITRRLNYSRLTVCDEAVFVKGTHDWIDLLCLLWAVQSRRCRRRRKDSGEKRGGGSGGEGLSWGADATMGDSGAGAQGLTEGLQQPSACTNQMLWGVGGGGQKGGGGAGENVGPRGRRYPHFLPRHFSREHKALFVVCFKYHNLVMGSVNGHSRRLRGGPSETTKRKLGRWRWEGGRDATSKRS